VRAGSNPPSVFTIFRFAAYLNLVQDPRVLFGFAPCGSDFSFLDWKSQVLPSLYSRLDFFLYCCQSSLIIHRRITFLYGGRSFLCLDSVSCSSSHYEYISLIQFQFYDSGILVCWNIIRLQNRINFTLRFCHRIIIQ